MSKEQKDQQVTNNQGGQQNQGGQFNRDNQRKDGPTEKSSAVVAEDDEQTDIPKEFPDKKQHNGDKAPAGERNRQEDQGGSQREKNVADANKNERSTQDGNQNKNQSSPQAADKKS